jgi:asparagine synthase (glutamine-hydrolysing)
MPGIAGIFATAPSLLYEKQVRRMVATLRHHPETESGVVLEPSLGVYAGWAAHVGSFAARQCAAAAGSAHTTLLLAGECFGRDASLSIQDCARGKKFIAELNGLFAGLVIDRDQRQALLFNDRYGGERLYTVEKGGAIYFASEAKALLAVLPEFRTFDDTGVAQWLAFGSTLGGRTLFRGIELVPGGSVWTFGPGSPMRRERFFRPAQWEALPPLQEAEFADQLSETFGSLLPDYLRGGQRVGLSLTGGLDTRMIAACLPVDALPAVAYTYASDDDRLLDLTIARTVATARGIPHQALRIGQDFLAQYPRCLDRTVWISDGNAGALAAHELPLSELARSLAPVRLTGNFGSEVLRSMSTFKRNGPANELLEDAFTTQIEALVAEQQARVVHPVTRAAFEEVPWHLFGTLAVARSQLTFRTPFMDNRFVELTYRAPAAARRTPSPSLRVIHDHSTALATLPTDRGVMWGSSGLGARLRRLSAEANFKLDYWHKEGLPDTLARYAGLLGAASHFGLLGRHKFLAYRSWFSGTLAPYAEQVMSDARTHGLPFWNRDALGTMAREHAKGQHNRLREIHAVLTLEAVRRVLFDEASYVDRTAARV